MKNKTFRIILFILLGICAALTIAHLIYTVDAYQHCSIIRFIGEELW
ncbi:MAG: hypothetical protein IJB57_00125 [Clostridia bacterium]|nr:hypothetical protein [Clostridia bacterium]